MALGILGGIASGIISSVTGNSQLQNQLDFQREENERTRRYNLELAKLQNKWNVEQWSRENEYNSPKEMRRRLEMAGYNPNIVGNSLSGSLNSASSPGLTSGAPGVSTDYLGLGRMDNPVSAAARGAMDVVQARNMEAQTDKTKSETDYQKVVNEFLPETLRSQLKVSDATAKEIVERSKNYQFEANRINADINRIEAQTNLAKQQGRQAVRYSEYIDAMKQNLSDRLTLDWYKESNFVELWSRELDISADKLAEVCRQFDFENGITTDGVPNSPQEMQYNLMQILRSNGIKVGALKNQTLYLDFAMDKISQCTGIAKSVLEGYSDIKSVKHMGQPTSTTVRRFEEIYDATGEIKGSRHVEERRDSR